MVHHPEFGINLFLKDFLLKLSLLIHELLFSFDLGTSSHEHGLLLSKFIGFHFEFSIESLLDLLLSFGLTRFLEGIESLLHFSSNLFGCFKIGHEFLFVLLIFIGEEVSQSLSTSGQVSSLSLAHVIDSVTNNILSNSVVGLGLPVCF